LVVAEFETLLLFRHFPGGTDENHEKPVNLAGLVAEILTQENSIGNKS
jgi:hypothetical protein